MKGVPLADDSHARFLEHFLGNQGAIETFLFLAVRDRVAVDDLMQEIAIVLWTEFARYDPTRPFAPWARGIAYNIILRHRRATGRSMRVLSPEALQSLLDAAAHEEADTAPSDRQRALGECLERVPLRLRTLLSLRYGEGLSLDEVARRSDRQVEAVKKALARLRVTLRDCVHKKTGHRHVGA